MGQRSSNGAIISTRRALASKRLMLEEAGAECFDLQHALPPCFCLALRFFWRGAEGVDVGRAGRQPREGIANNLGRIVNAGYLAVADRLPECGRFHHWRGYADDIDAASPKLGPERFRQIEDETLDPRINGDTGLTTQSCARPHQHDPATSALPHGTSEDMQSLSGCQHIAGDQFANGFDRGVQKAMSAGF